MIHTADLYYGQMPDWSREDKKACLRRFRREHRHLWDTVNRGDTTRVLALLVMLGGAAAFSMENAISTFLVLLISFLGGEIVEKAMWKQNREKFGHFLSSYSRGEEESEIERVTA